MAYVATPLNIPTFLSLRNRIKQDPLNQAHLKLHLTKNRQLLAKKCVPPEPEKPILYRKDRLPCRKTKPTAVNRVLAPNRTWVLPPNRYNVLDEPYARHKGLQGAYWPKVHVKKTPLPQKLRTNLQSVDHDSKPTDRTSNACNKYKGFFNSNARNRKPSTRFMVSDLTTCWRDPNDPGPLDYCTERRQTKTSGNFMREKPNPHKFILQTCVPEKDNALYKKNIHFLPGPGRYETRLRNICALCTVKRQVPFITQEVEKQKRLKFRRLPYKKINIRKYCDPQFAHIRGHGFPHLFRKTVPRGQVQQHGTPSVKSKNVKSTKDIKLHADPKYMNMINNPDRRGMVVQVTEHEIPVNIVFNTLAKRLKRRHLESNKKIAFMSGQTRWKDAERPLPITVTQLEELKLKIPPERRLYDHQITATPLDELESRVREIPPHMKPAYKTGLKKRLYKFKPLPGPKVLVTEDDIRAFYENGKYIGKSFFFEPINPEKFYKEKDDDETDISKTNVSRSSIHAVAALESKPAD